MGGFNPLIFFLDRDVIICRTSNSNFLGFESIVLFRRLKDTINAASPNRRRLFASGDNTHVDS